MPEKLNESIVESVASVNFKNLGDMPAFYTGQMMSNSVSHQNRLQILAESALNQCVKGMNELDPVEALGLVKGLTGNDVAKQISDLGASIASLQQYVKGAQSTPPETAVPVKK